MNNIYREITPLTNDCFSIFHRKKNRFSFPLHTHEEFELNLIWNAKDAKRIVGYHVGEIDDIELVFVGENIPHGWFNHGCVSENINEITIQFRRDLFDQKFLEKNELNSVRALLEKSQHGILFSKEIALQFKSRIEKLTTKKNFNSVLELMSILNDLSITGNMQLLSNVSVQPDRLSFNSRRLEKAFEFMRGNYDKVITLSHISKVVNMSEVSFSRFIRKRTGRTFTESLNDIRLGHASRLLVDTTQTIAEIAYNSGFNNLSYFNRVFRKKNKCTPKEFRENYCETKNLYSCFQPPKDVFFNAERDKKVSCF